jgi:hypothetical protein
MRFELTYGNTDFLRAGRVPASSSENITTQQAATLYGHFVAYLSSAHARQTPQMHVNPLNTELNPICHLLALLGAHHIFHVSRIRVKAL